PTTGSIDWDWGDGSTHGTGYSAPHAYTFLSPTNTIFTIVATVHNPYGCVGTETATKSIVVLPAPVAFISPTGPLTFCGSFSTTLYGDLTSGYEHTQKLYWATTTGGLFDSCTYPTYPCANQTITSIGNYYIIAVGDNGCRDTSNVVGVDTSCGTPPPPCTLVPAGWDVIDTALVSCGIVHLHGSYAGLPLTAFSWTWLPPSHATGITTTNTTLDCTFDAAGLFTFGYRVGFADTLGDTCYVTHDTTILVPIIPGRVHTISCATGGAGYNVTLIDHSNYFPTTPPHNYSWYINTVLQPPAQTTSNTYSTVLAPGTYTLGEWVYYGPGMSDSCYASDIITLDTLPHAGFTFFRDTTCS